LFRRLILSNILSILVFNINKVSNVGLDFKYFSAIYLGDIVPISQGLGAKPPSKLGLTEDLTTTYPHV
jgi:hypothetical protein